MSYPRASCFWFAIGIGLTALLARAEDGKPPVGFLEEFPKLKEDLYQSLRSPWFMGVGVTPLAFLGNRLGVGVSPLQIHWISGAWDLELVDFSVMSSLGSQEKASRRFAFRASPKLRIFEGMSLGPAVGYELVSFPEVLANLERAALATPLEPFSSNGFFYGLVLTERFALGSDTWLRVSQSFIRQTYGIPRPSATEWGYTFSREDIEKDPLAAGLGAGNVFQVEVSLLF